MDRDAKIRHQHKKKMKNMLDEYYNYKIQKELEPLYYKAIKERKIKAEREHQGSLRDQNLQATGETKNVKGNLISKDGNKEALKKDQARQKQIKKAEKKKAKAAATAAKKA